MVPTHWAISGAPDRFGGKLQTVLLPPLVMLAIGLIFSFVPNYDRFLFIRFNDRGSDLTTVRPEYDGMIAIILTFLLAMHTFAIASGLGVLSPTQGPVLLTAVASIGIIAIGNYMPRITQRNAFIGVRLPWAYASDEVWRRTQRAGGYALVLAGIVGLVGAIALPSAPMKPLLVAIITQLLFVMVYSYSLAHSRDVP